MRKFDNIMKWLEHERAFHTKEPYRSAIADTIELVGLMDEVVDLLRAGSYLVLEGTAFTKAADRIQRLTGGA